MDNEELAALIGKPVQDQTPAPVVDAEPPAEPTAADRDALGRFAAKAAAETAPETPVSDPGATEPPLTKKELDGTLTALLSERDRRQAAEKRAEAAEARIAAVQPPQALSPDDRAQQEIHDLRLAQHRLSVEVEHGKSAVKDAYDWAFKRCDEDPAFNAQMTAQIGFVGNPWQVAVKAHQEHKQLEEFTAWKAAQAAPQAAPQPDPPQTAPTPPVPRSLATAPGNGAAGKPHVPVGEGNAYASVIK